MDKQQAKFLLASYHPDRNSKSDPSMEEALALAKSDADLGAWLEREIQNDHVIRDRFAQIPVPSDLASTILAGRYAAKAMPPTPRRHPVWLKAAAILVGALLAGWAGSEWIGHLRPAPLAAFQRSMPQFVLQGFTLDYVDDNLGLVTRWLERNRSVKGIPIPEGLAELTSVGCRSLKWQGKEVALICFYLPDGHEVHLFAIRSKDLDQSIARGATQNSHQGPWSNVAWTDGEWTCLATGRLQQAELLKLTGKNG
jgi:hypothetical protein